MPIISRVLIANRGEIASRIIRTVRAMGLKSIAVYSDADDGAPHMRQADEAVHIGPAPVGESYLSIERIIEAAKQTGADAIHPGYGFLSENADFAQACAAAGIVFVGPPAAAIELMGNKAESKRRMLAAKVPCIPGYEDKDQSDESLIAAGAKIGVPLMVKAAAGGGGRGMRLVEDHADLADAIARARSEAENAFGSGELILEKAVMNARHVEIQVFADTQGNVVHLGERECSVQRRHQKVLEEAPCAIMTPALRDEMGTAAVRVASAIDYVGAGTVEFLLDGESRFYFLEMNTRLQVEHPVTELVTGLDLVEMQLRVAQGEALEIAQDEVGFNGHAIEARLYAEDPAQDFLPATGRIALWRPGDGAGIRVDDGIRTGQEISPYYDAMVAKIVAHGPTRDIARRRLVRALRETTLFGPTTNKSFLIACLEHETFRAGKTTTAFIGEAVTPASDAGSDAGSKTELEAAALASVLRYAHDCERALDSAVIGSRRLCQWSSGFPLATHYRYGEEDTQIDVMVRPQGQDRYLAEVGDISFLVEIGSIDGSAARVSIDGNRHIVRFQVPAQGQLWLSHDGADRLFLNRLAAPTSDLEEASAGRVTSPMHGVVLEVFISQGDTVEKGQRLLVLEAMKMQHEITATAAGVIEEIHSQAGAQVASDDPLVTITEATEATPAG